MKLSTSTNMVFERINMEPISQERGILLCVQAGYRCFPNKKILRNSPCLPACKQKNIATRLRDTT